jgi:hypothetical protein
MSLRLTIFTFVIASVRDRALCAPMLVWRRKRAIFCGVDLAGFAFAFSVPSALDLGRVRVGCF